MADFQRQLDILPPSALVYPVTFIGLGGIGSWVSYIVYKMGFSRIVLWDNDRVERHNFPSQHYGSEDIGELKTDAMVIQLKGSLGEETVIVIETKAEEFTSGDDLEGVVISGVDSMKSRSEIWQSVLRNRNFVPLYIDGRIGIQWSEEEGGVTGEWIEVFTVVPARLKDREFYEGNLFSDEEAEPLRCTAQAVAYIGPLIAGFMASNLKKWVMCQPYPRHRLYDVLTEEMILVTS